MSSGARKKVVRASGSVEEDSVGPPKRPGKWRALGGKARCERCIRKQLDACWINDEAIGKWEDAVDAGKVFTKAPSGIACEECHSKRNKCNLPKTERLRELLPEGSKAAGKRKQEEPTVEDEEDEDEDEDEIEVRSKRSRVASGTPVREAQQTIVPGPDDVPKWFTPAYLLLTVLSRDQRKATSALERIANSVETMADEMGRARRLAIRGVIALEHAAAYLEGNDGDFEGSEPSDTELTVDEAEAAVEAAELAEAAEQAGEVAPEEATEEVENAGGSEEADGMEE